MDAHRQGAGSGGRVSGARALRLLAAAVALALAVSAALALGIASAVAGPGAPSLSKEGSTLGMLVDSAPSQEDVDSGAYTGNGSYLDLMVAADEMGDVRYAYMVAGAGGEDVVYWEGSVPYGQTLPRPNDPVWNDNYAPPDGVDGTPRFDRWFVREGDGSGPDSGVALKEYDFSSRVTEEVVLWAGWAQGDKVAVTFDASDAPGATVQNPDDPAQAPAQKVVLMRYPGTPFGLLPTATRPGYTLECWVDEGGEPVGAGTLVPDGGATLKARWKANTFHIHYDFNDGSHRSADQRGLVYDGADQAFFTWEAATDGLGEDEKYLPQNKELFGWSPSSAYKEGDAVYAPGSAMRNLTTEPGGWVVLYAVWKEKGTVEEGPFSVTFMTNDKPGGGDVYRGFPEVEKGSTLDAFDDPKRTGYQFSCWRVGIVGEDGSIALGREWTFDEQVVSDLTLYAEWILRLDVALPVEVGFAVDAESREVTTPEADLYAIKSRTVAPVQVEEVAVISDEDEIEEFFNLREGQSDWLPALRDTKLWVWNTGSKGVAAWTTDFTQAPDGAGGLSFALPLANAAGERGEYTRVNPDGTAGEKIVGWRSAVSLAGNEAFRLEKFEYGGAFDEGWQGGDPSVRLPLKLGMGISDLLEVETALDGPKPLTHLVVTVSVQG